MTNFTVIKSIKTDFDITITKYKSKVTGLTVVLVDYQGMIRTSQKYQKQVKYRTNMTAIFSYIAPLVDGFFTVVTEGTNK